MNLHLARILTELARSPTPIMLPESFANNEVFTDTSMDEFCRRFNITLSSETSIIPLKGQTRRVKIRRYYILTPN